MKKTSTLSIAATALLAGGIAYAQAENMPAQGADMTREQAQERAQAMFARMDANSDGQIDAEDRQARQRARFDQLDSDGDGSISFAEFQSGHADMGGMGMGQGRGGMQGHQGMQGGQHGQMQGQRGMQPGQHGQMQGHAGMMAGMHRGMVGGMAGMMSNADSDGDGAISQAEFEAAAMAHFDSMDADNDGTVSADERRAMRTERRMQHQRGN
jgi:Ca2+-binding EF-hand superfamily protein